MTYRDRAATIGAEADAALEAAADRLQLEQEKHADTRGELSREQTAHETLQQEYTLHMATEHPTDPPPDPDPEPEPEPSEVADLVAVRVFPHYSSRNYGEHEKVLTLLGQLGIKRISGLLGPSTVQHVGGFYKKAFDRYGIKTWFTVGAPREVLTDAQWTAIGNALKGAPHVEIVSGWNEPNHSRGGGTLPSNWADTTAAHQARLWDIAHPLGLMVGTPQLWSGTMSTHDADLKKLAPKIVGKYDTTSWHLYPRGTVGKDWVDRFYGLYESVLGKHPVVCTEAGYFTGSADGTGANPVTEAQQADFLPKHVRLYTDRGDRISYFELLDDPSGGREGSLGLVRADWTPKPAFGTLRDMLTA